MSNPLPCLVTPLPPEAARVARTAAIAGTRELVHSETLTALVTLLIGAGAVPAADVHDTVKRLAGKLSGYAEGHPEWNVCPAELQMQARRLDAMADEIGAES